MFESLDRSRGNFAGGVKFLPPTDLLMLARPRTSIGSSVAILEASKLHHGQQQTVTGEWYFFHIKRVGDAENHQQDS